MSNKERWQKLAGILTEEKEAVDVEEDTETLKEGFKNLGMASPGIMGGNPFERPGNVTTEQIGEYEDDDEGGRDYDAENEEFIKKYPDRDKKHKHQLGPEVTMYAVPGRPDVYDVQCEVCGKSGYLVIDGKNFRWPRQRRQVKS